MKNAFSMKDPPDCANCGKPLHSVDIERELHVRFVRNAQWNGEERWEVRDSDTYSVDFQTYGVSCPDCKEDHYYYLEEGPEGFPYIGMDRLSAWIVRDINGHPVNEKWFKPEAMRPEEV